MTDLDLMMAGAMVTFLSVAGAYINMRRRADESPVGAYDSVREHEPVRPPPAGHSDRTK